MSHDILLAIWFLLPAALANAVPVFAAVIPPFNRWQAPLDGGRIFRGKELLGPHKTWRGLISGILVATITLWLQQLAVAHFSWAHQVSSGVDYASLPTLLMGPLLGIGALGGDAVESFFKRQSGVHSGEPWIPFDQLDYIIGSVLVSLPFAILSLSVYIWITLIWFVTHLLVSYIGWLVGLKGHPI